MPIAVRCPNPECGKIGQVPERFLHQFGRCPKCQTKFKFDSSLATDANARDTMLPAAVPATLQEPSAQAVAQAPPPAPPRAPNETPTQIGRFEIRAHLGSGAFGDVYRA